MITPAKERMRKSRAHRRLGLRPVQVLVSEQDIDFLLARHYELTRTDDRSIGRAVSAFLSDTVLLEAAYAEGAMQKIREASKPATN
jgi:Pyruvate/2-oxoacid:ferredoxin oxidoreductase gamma subunit